MEPTEKDTEITNFLENLYGRSTAIKNNRCLDAPIGCGKQIRTGEFRTVLDLKEYKISGFCMNCQDSIYAEK